jgi:alpha/beta superfamily hydrolase
VIVLIIRGLLSIWLSAWDKEFQARLQNHHVYDAISTDHGWGFAWFSNVSTMIAWCLAAHQRKEKIVLVGHSFGATSVIMITEALHTHGITVDFAGPIDPAGQYDCSIPNNVARGLSFYQRTPGQLGQGIVHPDHTWTKGEWDKVWTVQKRNETHLQIASDPLVQDRMVEEVVKCLRS